MSQGQGNVTFSGLSTNAGSSGGGGGAATAHNGVSIDAGGFVQLGNVAGDPGQPGKLIDQQEIDLNGFGLQFDWPGSGVTSLFAITAGGAAMLEYFKGLTGQHPMEIITIQGQSPGLNPYGNFWVTLDEATINPDLQRDAVLQWGYNQNGGGGTMLPGECEVHYAIESHFQEGGSAQNEIHLESTSRAGNKNRIFSFTPNIFNGNCVGFFTVNDLQFFASNTSTAYFSMGSSGTAVLEGPAANFSVLNSQPGFGSLVISTNADGSVNLADTGGGSNPTIAFENAVAINNTNPANGAVNINLANQDNVIGTQLAGVVTAGAGNAAVTFAEVQANGILYSFIDNTGTGDSGYVARVAVGNGNAEIQLSNADNSKVFSFGLLQSAGNFVMTNGTGITLGNNLWTMTPSGQSGFGGEAAPTAFVHIAASPGTAGSGPLKLTAGPLLAVPEDGLIEYDGTNFWKTIAAVRTIIT
jgi:hypothetical protein